jgi:hypothetical protein
MFSHEFKRDAKNQILDISMNKDRSKKVSELLVIFS